MTFSRPKRNEKKNACFIPTQRNSGPTRYRYTMRRNWNETSVLFDERLNEWDNVALYQFIVLTNDNIILTKHSVSRYQIAGVEFRLSEFRRIRVKTFELYERTVFDFFQFCFQHVAGFDVL